MRRISGYLAAILVLPFVLAQPAQAQERKRESDEKKRQDVELRIWVGEMREKAAMLREKGRDDEADEVERAIREKLGHLRGGEKKARREGGDYPAWVGEMKEKIAWLRKNRRGEEADELEREFKEKLGHLRGDQKKARSSRVPGVAGVIAMSIFGALHLAGQIGRITS